MAKVKKQNFITLPGLDQVIGIHKLEMESGSAEDITVPTLANTTAGASTAQLRKVGQGAATVTSNGATTLRVTGTAGEEIIALTLHEKVAVKT